MNERTNERTKIVLRVRCHNKINKCNVSIIRAGDRTARTLKIENIKNINHKLKKTCSQDLQEE